ncbi:MAG: hypothetical protein ACKO2N_18610 [Tabrizicola sp.]
MPSLHPLFLIAALLAHLVAMRMGSFFLPDRLYFSFSAFLFDTRDLEKTTAVAFKLLVPYLVSALLMAAALGWERLRRPEPTQRMRLEGPATLAFAACFAAVLMAWPYILLWDLLIAPELSGRRIPFLLAYMFYFAATALVALAGANTALALIDKGWSAGIVDENGKLSLAAVAGNRFARPLVELIGSALVASLAALVAQPA